MQEIQFFSEASIRDFNSQDCSPGFCFEGDYPGLDRYSGQKVALANGEDWENYKFMTFGERNFLVTNLPCTGESCLNREYTTFIDDTKVDTWILLENVSQVEISDELFRQLILLQLEK